MKLMRHPAVSSNPFLLGTVIVLAGLTAVRAQSSNQLWFVTYNGQPTPSLDVSVRSLVSNGTGTALATGTASNFVTQVDFHNFNSPCDLAVDPAMGKVYVLDNNLQGATNEVIYSFNLTGTPAQVAASQQIIYTMPIPTADVTVGTYPLLSGIALDPAQHYLYFNQVDIITGSNAYVGRLDLASSLKSNIHGAGSGNPTLQTYYVGQVPGQGTLAVDATNIYLGAINGQTGNSGVYVARRDGSGGFSEIVTVSTNDLTFTNGFISGLASDPADHLVYYLTFNAGYLNYNFNLAQNAVWVYDTVGRTSRKISSGYPGYPDNLAMDPGNGRYYFTVGRDGTGSIMATNYQAIYTGILGSTNAPTLFYTPSLSGQDAAGQINAGGVALQGIFIVGTPALLSVASPVVYPTLGVPVTLAPGLVVSDPNSSLLNGATVAITAGTFTNDGDLLAAATNGTAITANYNRSTKTLTLAGSDSLVNYQQVLRSVTFASTNSNPTQSGTNATRTLAWIVSDGLFNSTAINSTVLILPPGAPALNHLAIAPAAKGWALLFSGISSQKYVFQSATNLPGPWADLSTVLTSSLGFLQYTDSFAPLPRTRFYRVRTSP